MVKPDGVQRRLVGSIIARFEAKGFQLLALRQIRCSVPGLKWRRSVSQARRCQFRAVLNMWWV